MNVNTVITNEFAPITGVNSVFTETDAKVVAASGMPVAIRAESNVLSSLCNTRLTGRLCCAPLGLSLSL